MVVAVGSSGPARGRGILPPRVPLTNAPRDLNTVTGRMRAREDETFSSVLDHLTAPRRKQMSAAERRRIDEFAEQECDDTRKAMPPPKSTKKTPTRQDTAAQRQLKEREAKQEKDRIAAQARMETERKRKEAREERAARPRRERGEGTT